MSISNKKGIQRWQVEQAREALKLLYHVYLKLPIPIHEASPVSSTKSDFKSTLTSNNFRDTLAQKDEILKMYGDLFEKIRKEIRYRHYSIRTERSYVDWIARYLIFFNKTAPEKLEAIGSGNILTTLPLTEKSLPVPRIRH